jgi:hypothetical protein
LLASPPGPTQSLRSKYKNKMDYQGQYAIIHTSAEKTSRDARMGYATTRDHEFVAILSLCSFLQFFGDPVAMANLLEKKGSIVARTWNEKNSDRKMVGHRKPCGVTFDIASYEWRTNKGRNTEKSVYCLQISSYAFTINHMQDEEPAIKQSDLKVS